MDYNKLTAEEKRVIVDKGTEKPFTGDYDDLFEPGAYICRRCDALLYESKDKFHSHCGWPSFDEEVKGAVDKKPDIDGLRTEIACANCGAHLGHVFSGEKYTPKDMRHCVNSISMRFIPLDFKPGEPHSIVLGGGCFWCIDAAFRVIKGITKITSGYAGGHKSMPTYEEVAKALTGHAEVVELEYDPAIISFKQILGIFFTIHNPTTPNRQGHDDGEQYRSVILYKTWRQKEEIDSVIRRLEEENAFGAPVITQVKPHIKFYPAEEYHQEYCKKNPDEAYCQIVILPKIKKLKDNHRDLIRA